MGGKEAPPKLSLTTWPLGSEVRSKGCSDNPVSRPGGLKMYVGVFGPCFASGFKGSGFGGSGAIRFRAWGFRFRVCVRNPKPKQEQCRILLGIWSRDGMLGHLGVLCMDFSI